MIRSAQKTPLSRTLNKFATNKALDAIEQLGQALPGHVVGVSGAIITVNFDVIDGDTGLTLSLPTVDMPLFGPEYIRYPIKKGDLGVAFPADLYIGGVSGLGGGIADDTPRGNLSSLVWFPIGNKNWTGVDTNAVTIYGPNGVVLRDTNSQSVRTLTPTGILDSTQGDYEIDAGGGFKVDTTGDSTIQSENITLSGGVSLTLRAAGHTILINSAGISIDGALYALHKHIGVTTGSDESGPVGP